MRKILAALGATIPFAFAFVLMTADRAAAQADDIGDGRVWGICNCGETCEGDCSTGPYICC